MRRSLAWAGNEDAHSQIRCPSCESVELLLHADDARNRKSSVDVVSPAIADEPRGLP